MVGYKPDDKGKCNLCDSKYINISTNPLLCAMQIENCIKHAYDGIIKPIYNAVFYVATHIKDIFDTTEYPLSHLLQFPSKSVVYPS